MFREDSYYFEDKEGTMIEWNLVSNVKSIPDEAVGFVYIHQGDQENNFLRTYRIGKRIQKSIFDFYLNEEIENSADYLVVSRGINCDYCLYPTPEKNYFYAVDDDDVIVKNKEELQDALFQAISTRGEYSGAPQLKK